MAEEIKIACSIWPNPVTNANAYYARPSQANNLFIPQGIVLPDTVVSDVCFMTMSPIPTDINATPAGILRIGWWTPSADVANNIELTGRAGTAVAGTTSWDPAAWTTDVSVQDLGTGIYEVNHVDITLVAIAAGLISGNYVFGVIQRDAQVGNGQDTLAADILLLNAVFVANT